MNLRTKSTHSVLLLISAIVLALAYQNCADNKWAVHDGGITTPLNTPHCEFGPKNIFNIGEEDVEIGYSVSNDHVINVQIYNDGGLVYESDPLSESGLLPDLDISEVGTYDVYGFINQSRDYSCHYNFTVIEETGNQIPTIVDSITFQTPTCKVQESGKFCTNKFNFVISSLNPNKKVVFFRKRPKPSSDGFNYFLLENPTPIEEIPEDGDNYGKVSLTDNSKTWVQAHELDRNAGLENFIPSSASFLKETEVGETAQLDTPIATTVTDLLISPSACEVANSGGECTSDFSFKVPTLASNKKVVFFRKRSSGALVRLTIPTSVNNITNGETGKVSLTDTANTTVRAYEVDKNTAPENFTPTSSTPILSESPGKKATLKTVATTVTEIKISTPRCEVTSSGAFCNNNFTFKIPTLASGKKVVFFRKRPNTAGTGFNFFILSPPAPVETATTAGTGVVPLTDNSDTTIRAYEVTDVSGFTPNINTPFLKESSSARATLKPVVTTVTEIKISDPKCEIASSGAFCNNNFTFKVPTLASGKKVVFFRKRPNTTGTGFNLIRLTNPSPVETATTTGTGVVPLTDNSDTTIRAYEVTNVSGFTPNINTPFLKESSKAKATLRQTPDLTINSRHYRLESCSAETCPVYSELIAENIPSGKVIQFYREETGGAEEAVSCFKSGSPGYPSRVTVYVPTSGAGTYKILGYLADSCNLKTNLQHTSSEFTIQPGSGGGGGGGGTEPPPGACTSTACMEF